MTIAQTPEPASREDCTYPATDHLDREIATKLALDARLSFRSIAAELGVSEGAVRSRVKRLQAAGLLKWTPIVDIARERGNNDQGSDGQLMMFITITYARGKFAQVRDALLAMNQIHALYDANAAPRLIAVCVLPSINAAATIANQILQIEGVRQAETELVLKTIKYNAAIGPIATLDDIATPQDHGDGG